jgi:tRNA(fMet)-specific endonuclease VapC
MNERYLLDTAVASLAARGDGAIVRKLAYAAIVYVPSIVQGEMMFGAYRYARIHSSTKFLDLYDRFLQDPRYTSICGDLDTARIYGAIRAELEATGRPIQRNDIWIAALARQHRLILLSRDGDFARVSGLGFEIV